MNGLTHYCLLGPALAAAIFVAAPTRAGADQVAQVQEAAPEAEKRVLFALVYRPGPKWRRGKPFREQIAIGGHFAYMKSLFAGGQIFSAGGMGAEHGLVLLYARDQAEADAILAADPMVQAGSFSGEVRRYTPAFLSDGPLRVTKE